MVRLETFSLGDACARKRPWLLKFSKTAALVAVELRGQRLMKRPRWRKLLRTLLWSHIRALPTFWMLASPGIEVTTIRRIEDTDRWECKTKEDTTMNIRAMNLKPLRPKARDRENTATRMNRSASSSDGQKPCPWCNKVQNSQGGSHVLMCAKAPWEYWVRGQIHVRKGNGKFLEDGPHRCEYCRIVFESDRSKKIHRSYCVRRRTASGLTSNLH